MATLAFPATLICVIVLTPAQGAPLRQCHPGEYLNKTSNLCLPCPTGTYQDEEQHRYTNCAECTKENTYHHQVVIAHCTAVSDSDVGCQTGFYAPHKFKGHPFDCEQCSSCTNQTVVKNCSQSQDAVCGSPNSPLTPATTLQKDDETPTASGTTEGPKSTRTGKTTSDSLSPGLIIFVVVVLGLIAGLACARRCSS